MNTLILLLWNAFCNVRCAHTFNSTWIRKLPYCLVGCVDRCWLRFCFFFLNFSWTFQKLNAARIVNQQLQLFILHAHDVNDILWISNKCTHCIAMPYALHLASSLRLFAVHFISKFLKCYFIIVYFDAGELVAVCFFFFSYSLWLRECQTPNIWLFTV